MKILQINIRVNKGSVSRITEQIGLKVIERGWESYIAYGRPSNPSQSHLIHIGSSIGVKWHYMMSQLTGRHGLFSTKATKEFVKMIGEIKPDVIHLQNIHGYYLNYKVLFEYLNSTDIPVVWTLHDCWGFTGHCSHFVTAGCERWKIECHDCPLKLSYPSSLLFDRSREDYQLKKELFTGNRNITLVPVSYWLEGLVKESFLQCYNTHVIQNGVDLKVFYPRGYHCGEKFRIVGVASVWNKDKGLIDYFRLREQLDKTIFEITLVGLNENQIQELPDGINGVKRTDTIDILAEYYSNADVVTSLSSAETFGMTPVEGMACGTPAIVYNNTAQPELIDKSCGLVVPSGDIEALKEAVYEIRRKGKAFYSKACVERARSMFNKEEKFNEYIELYKELCKQKK